jgi:hypothetical protein
LADRGSCLGSNNLWTFHHIRVNLSSKWNKGSLTISANSTTPGSKIS